MNEKKEYQLQISFEDLKSRMRRLGFYEIPDTFEEISTVQDGIIFSLEYDGTTLFGTLVQKPMFLGDEATLGVFTTLFTGSDEEVRLDKNQVDLQEIGFYRKEVDRLSAEISILEANNLNMANQVASISADRDDKADALVIERQSVESLKEQLEKLESALSDLQKKYDELQSELTATAQTVVEQDKFIKDLNEVHGAKDRVEGSKKQKKGAEGLEQSHGGGSE